MDEGGLTSTAIEEKIQSFDSRGWARNRARVDEHHIVGLKRVRDTFSPGRFTCDIHGDIDTPRSLLITAHSECIPIDSIFTITL